MAKTFHLTIAKVGENLFDADAQSVTLPGEDGQFTVMAGHEAFVTPLTPGTAHIKHGNGDTTDIEILGAGIAEVSGDQATVIL